MKHHKAVSTLSLCRRAGKLVTGFDAVAECAASGDARLLAAASDISAKTRKEIVFLADKYNIPMTTVPATMDELLHVLGKRVGVMAVTDSGLAGAISNALGRQEEEDTL